MTWRGEPLGAGTAFWLTGLALLLGGCGSRNTDALPADVKERVAVAQRLTGERRRAFLIYIDAIKRGMPLPARPTTVSGAIAVGQGILAREQRERNDEKAAIAAMTNAAR